MGSLKALWPIWTIMNTAIVTISDIGLEPTLYSAKKQKRLLDLAGLPCVALIFRHDMTVPHLNGKHP